MDADSKQKAGERRTRRIAFVSIPHIFAESEEARGGGPDSPPRHRPPEGKPEAGPSEHASGSPTAKNPAHPAAKDPLLPLVIVSGSFPRGVIIDYSRALERSAVKRGAFVKSIEPFREKIRVLTADYEYVEEVHRRIVVLLKNYSPLVESPKAGHYYLDLTGTVRLFGRELDTCGRIIGEIGRTFGLHARVGIGSTTLVSRLAARVSGERGVYDVAAPSETLFLAPLGVELLPGVSLRAKRELLDAYNIRRIGDLEPFTREDLAGMFGREGETLYRCARNDDPSFARGRLLEKKTERILEQSLVVSSESNDDDALRRQFFSTVLALCARMREERVLPGAFGLKVIYQDNERRSFGGRLARPSSFEKDLYEALIDHVNQALKRRTCVKKFVLSFSRLVPDARQLELFRDELRTERLAGAFDTLQRRFGKGSIRYGR
jgi:DNA polymerase-4